MPEALRRAKAIVLDKDGVILDFRQAWLDVARRRAEAVATRFSRPEWIPNLLAASGVQGETIDPEGPLAQASRQEAVALLSGWLYLRGVPWHRAFHEVSLAFDDAEAGAETVVPALPGALKAIACLQEAGFLLAVATTDRTARCQSGMAAIGLSDRFGAQVGADRVQRGKPFPDLFLLACDELGVAPQKAIMVGDGVNDLLMGRAAGALATVGVTCGASDAAFLASHADLVLEDLTDLANLLI